MVTYLNGNVYVVGGRTVDIEKKDDYFIGSVEKINVGGFAEKFRDKKDKNKAAVGVDVNVAPQWASAPSLRSPRCDGQLVIIDNKIYCIGGIEQNGNRAELIERLDPSSTDAQWAVEETEFGLGTEASTFIRANSNELLFFGGQDDFHRLPYWGSIKFNESLDKTTYRIEGKLDPRNLPKIVAYKGSICLVGTRANGEVELIDTATKKLTIKKATGTAPKDLTSFAYSADPVSLSFSQPAQQAEKSVTWKATDGPRYIHVFGNDSTPAFITYDRASKKVKTKGVPLSVRQFSFSGYCRFTDTDAYFIGGESKDLAPEPNYISDLIYWVHLSGSKGKKLASVLPKPLSRVSVAQAEDKLVITGGVTFTDKCEVVNSGECYTFTPANGQIAPIGNLNTPRYEHASIYHKGAIYVIGGRESATQALDTIEKLTLSTGQWETLNVKLSQPLTKVGVIKVKDEAYIVGGETSDGTPVSEIQVLDLNNGKISVKVGALQEARESVKLWPDKKDSIGIYGGEQFKKGGEKIVQDPKNKAEDGHAKMRSSIDSEKQTIAKALEEYYLKYSTDVVFLA